MSETPDDATRQQIDRADALYALAATEFTEALEPVVAILVEAGWTRREAMMWCSSPTGWIPGRARPVDAIETDPEAVLHAARMMALGPGA